MTKEDILVVEGLESACTTKVCNKCGQEKPITEFQKSKTCSDGHVGQCNACINERVRARRMKSVTPPDENNPLSAYQPRELIAELRRRGYVGELKYTQVIKV